MQFQTSDQTLFNFLIFEKSRFPPKHLITWSTAWKPNNCLRLACRERQLSMDSVGTPWLLCLKSLGSNQVPTYLSQLLQLYSPWWSSVAIVTSNHCISGFCPMTQHPVQPNKGLSPRTAVVETGLREGKAMQRNLTKMVFSNGPTPASFCLSLVFSNKQYNSYNKSKWKNVHPVYGAEIQTHNISNMSCHQ